MVEDYKFEVEDEYRLGVVTKMRGDMSFVWLVDVGCELQIKSTLVFTGKEESFDLGFVANSTEFGRTAVIMPIPHPKPNTHFCGFVERIDEFESLVPEGVYWCLSQCEFNNIWTLGNAQARRDAKNNYEQTGVVVEKRDQFCIVWSPGIGESYVTDCDELEPADWIAYDVWNDLRDDFRFIVQNWKKINRKYKTLNSAAAGGVVMETTARVGHEFDFATDMLFADFVGDVTDEYSLIADDLDKLRGTELKLNVVYVQGAWNIVYLEVIAHLPRSIFRKSVFHKSATTNVKESEIFENQEVNSGQGDVNENKFPFAGSSLLPGEMKFEQEKESDRECNEVEHYSEIKEGEDDGDDKAVERGNESGELEGNNNENEALIVQKPPSMFATGFAGKLREKISFISEIKEEVPIQESDEEVFDVDEFLNEAIALFETPVLEEYIREQHPECDNIRKFMKFQKVRREMQ